MIELFWATAFIVITLGLVIINRPLKPKWVNFKYEILSYKSAVGSLIEDILMRNVNITELHNNKDKIAVITGGNKGIGKEVIRMLLQCQMTVIMGCRKIEEGKKLIDEFQNEGFTSGKLLVHPLDISSIDSIKKFVETIKTFLKIHILINNAGIMYVPYYEETKDGFESQFATNYLGHFLLTHYLYPCLKNAGEDYKNARIINVSSCAYEFGEINFDDINNKKTYSTYKAYSQSKLAQILFTNHLNKIFDKNGLRIQTHSVHPGLVNTDLFKNERPKIYFGWLFPYVLKSPMQGAMSIVFAAISPTLEGKGGTHITNCTVKPHKAGLDEKSEEELFILSNKLLGIKRFYSKDIFDKKYIFGKYTSLFIFEN